MKGMKARKILSLFVVLCMMFTYSGITVFADDELDGGGGDSTTTSGGGDSTTTSGGDGDSTTTSGGGDETTTTGGGGDETTTTGGGSDETTTTGGDDDGATQSGPAGPEPGVTIIAVKDGNSAALEKDDHGFKLTDNKFAKDKFEAVGYDVFGNALYVKHVGSGNEHTWTLLDSDKNEVGTIYTTNGGKVAKVTLNAGVGIVIRAQDSNKYTFYQVVGDGETTYTLTASSTDFWFVAGVALVGKLKIVKNVEVVEGCEFKGDTFKFNVSKNGFIITSAAITINENNLTASVTINNLPLDEYTVEEVGDNLINYNVSYSPEGAVTVAKNETTTVTVTNTLTFTPPPPPEQEFGALKIIKKVTGDGFTTDTFKFKVTGEDFTKEAEITVDEVDKEFTVITINGLAPGEYTVEEINVDAGKYTVTYSEEGGAVTVVENETATVKVTNKLIPPPPGPKPGKLTINKEVLHNGAQVSGNNVFFFKLYKDNEPYFVNGQQNVFKLTPENGFDKIEITLPAGVYTVEEVMDGDGTPIGEGFVYTVTYAIGEGARTAGLISSDIAIEEDGIGTVTFYNATTGGGGGGGGGGGRTTTTTTPTTDIQDPDVPLIRPEEVELGPEMIIVDEEVPLADIPQTGLDNDVAFNLLMLGFSLSALLAIFARKKDVTNK